MAWKVWKGTNKCVFPSIRCSHLTIIGARFSKRLTKPVGENETRLLPAQVRKKKLFGFIVKAPFLCPPHTAKIFLKVVLFFTHQKIWTQRMHAVPKDWAEIRMCEVKRSKLTVAIPNTFPSHLETSTASQNSHCTLHIVQKKPSKRKAKAWNCTAKRNDRDILCSVTSCIEDGITFSEPPSPEPLIPPSTMSPTSLSCGLSKGAVLLLFIAVDLTSTADVILESVTSDICTDGTTYTVGKWYWEHTWQLYSVILTWWFVKIIAPDRLRFCLKLLGSRQIHKGKAA